MITLTIKLPSRPELKKAAEFVSSTANTAANKTSKAVVASRRAIARVVDVAEPVKD